MSKTRRVFLSFSHQDRGLAEKLIEELHAQGISTVSSTENLEMGVDWQREIERAVKAADAVVVLVDSKHAPDRHQQFEWSAALEAEWEDPSKRLIPLLLRNAEVPSFLSNRPALKVQDPRKEWGRALEELVHVLKNEQPASGEFVSTEEEDPSKRRERLRYIEEAAQSLKTQ